MVYTKRQYCEYVDKLIKMGISPSVLLISDVIRLVTEDETKGQYDFSTDNIVAGSDGELIKINTSSSTIEIYNSIQDDYYSLRVYDIDTGELLPDGELSCSSKWVDSLKLYGEEKYYELLDLEVNDFSKVYAKKTRLLEEISIKNRNNANDYTRSRISETNIKEKLLNFSKKYSKRFEYINEAVSKMVFYIDDAVSKKANEQEFNSPNLSEETNKIITRKLYSVRLREESEAYSRISEAPVMDIIEEYKAYKTPKTDKIAKGYIKLSSKVNNILYPFIYSRVQFLGNQTSGEEFEQIEKTFQLLLLQRRNELDSNDLGEFDE